MVEECVPSPQRSPATNNPQFQERPLKEDGRAQKEGDRKKQKAAQDIDGGDAHGVLEFGPDLEKGWCKGRVGACGAIVLAIDH